MIQSIDGREPKDARHAMRILGSYQSGEKLKLGIMRDKKKKTLEIEIPADTHGAPVRWHSAAAAAGRGAPATQGAGVGSQDYAHLSAGRRSQSATSPNKPTGRAWLCYHARPC